MMLVCASLMKSGSTWWLRLANELLSRHGGVDTDDVRKRWRLTRVIKGDEYRIGSLRAHRLIAVTPAAFASSFAVKTHSPATLSFAGMHRLGAARATLNIRDPRDLAVSVAEHAEQRRSNPDALLRDIRSIGDAMDFVASQQPVFDSWQRRGVQMIRYEELTAEPESQVARLADLMDLDVSQEDAVAVVDAVREATTSGRATTKHNVGTAGRYRDVMNANERERADRVLGEMIHAMGYSGH